MRARTRLRQTNEGESEGHFSLLPTITIYVYIIREDKTANLTVPSTLNSTTMLRVLRVLRVLIFLCTCTNIVHAFKAGVYTLETRRKFLSLETTGKLVLRSSNPTNWAIQPVSGDDRVVTLTPHSNSFNTSAYMSYQTNCLSRSVTMSTRLPSSFILTYYHTKSRKGLYSFRAMEKSGTASNCRSLLNGQISSASVILSSTSSTSTKWKLQLVTLPPDPGSREPEEIRPSPVDWGVATTTVYKNETTASFDKTKEANLCLTLLNIASFPNVPTCAVSSIVALSSIASSGGTRRMLELGVSVNASIAFNTTTPEQAEQGLLGVKNLSSTNILGDDAAIVTVNGGPVTEKPGSSSPQPPPPTEPSPFPPPPPLPSPPPPQTPSPVNIVQSPATSAGSPTINSVALKNGAESNTVVVTWVPGTQSLPAAANPSFSVVCVASGSGCPSSPSYTLARPGGSTTTDVGSLSQNTAYDCYVIAKNWDGSKICSAPSSITTASGFSLAPNSVTILCPSAATGSTGIVNGVTYTKRDRAGLIAIIQSSDQSATATTCTSGITDMSNLFDRTGGPNNDRTFNADITRWDTSVVTTMASMYVICRPYFFKTACHSIRRPSLRFKDQIAFNQNIGPWSVASVTSMDSMLEGATKFNQNLQTWTLPNSGASTSCNFFADGALTWVDKYDGTLNCKTPPLSASMVNAGCSGNLPEFYLAPNGVTVRCPLAANLATGTVNGVTYTKRDKAQLIAVVGTATDANDLARSCISGVTDLNNLFFAAPSTVKVNNVATFNPDLSSWDTSGVGQFANLFRSMIAFNRDISKWNMASAWNINRMFQDATAFNQNLNQWTLEVQGGVQCTMFATGATQYVRWPSATKRIQCLTSHLSLTGGSMRMLGRLLAKIHHYHQQ